MVLQKNKTDLSYTLCSLLERYCREIKQTYNIYCANCQNGIVDKLTRPIIDTVLTIIKDCRQIKQIYQRKYFPCQNVLQTNQTDKSWTKCSLLEQNCRQIKQNYHRHRVNYQSGIVDKSNKPIIDTVLTIKMVWQTNQTDLSQKLCSPLERYCRQIKQIYHVQYVLYQNDIAVQQINQTDLSQILCQLLERYCRKIKQTYHRQCVNYQNSIVERSNRLIINTVLTIRTVLWTDQTHLSQKLC